MRRLPWGAAVASLLIIATSVATAAQRAPDGDTAMRTTDVPGSGLGVTLPVEWRILSFTDDRAREGIFASDVQGKRACAFKLLTDASSAVAMAAETVEAVSRHKYEVQQTTHDVPAGSAVRVSYHYLPDEPRFVQHEYYLDVPRGVVSVLCYGDPPAVDRWLSIVEAIAPLPAAGAAVVPFDPRVEVTANGLAVDFGAEWHVASASRWPGIVLGGDFVFRALMVSAADCWMEDVTEVPSLAEVSSPDDWRTAFIEAAGQERVRFNPMSPGRDVTEPTVVDAGLSSANGVRLDWEIWGGQPATTWVFLDGERRVVLFCRSEEPPDDRWLSIAETFRFLPAEE